MTAKKKTPKTASTTASKARRTASPTPEERHKMIAMSAYYLSLQRGPESDPWQNWLDAEAEVDARLK